MSKKQKLELTWIGKGEQPKLEPRILIEDPEKSYGDKNTHNMLIHGDNLLALKALEQNYTNRIKCIYIDPPFNTGQAFENYDDGLEHSLWLSLISDRIKILHKLLSSDGSLFVHIDDNELGYLIVLLDEIFGRNNRLYIVTFKQGSATGHKSINPGCVTTTNFVVMYAKNKADWSPNRVYTARERDKRYTQFIENYEDNYKDWKTCTLLKAYSSKAGISEAEARKMIKANPDLLDNFVEENAERVVRLARPDYKSVSERARQLIDKSKEEPDKVVFLQREGYSDMYFTNGERILFYSSKLKEIDGELIAGEPLTTLWDDILSNNLHNEGGIKFPKGKKPEFLIKRVFDLCTNAGDVVLDSFLGSGTTAAVAHKMGRKWIGIELGEHCETHALPRLSDVVNGKDTSGISNAVGWKGGGGFKYYYLAPSLLKQDKYGNWIIDERYNAQMLAAAMAKHEGFRYAPDEELYWKQGQSTEKDFIFTTTNFITVEQLDKIHEEMLTEESLLICCKSFSKACSTRYSNITVKKIPSMLLGRCEFGKEDYSLNIVNMPVDEDEPDFVPAGTDEAVKKKPKKKQSEPTLFGEDAE